MWVFIERQAPQPVSGAWQLKRGTSPEWGWTSESGTASVVVVVQNSPMQVLPQVGRASYLHLAKDGQPQRGVAPKYAVYLPRGDVFTVPLYGQSRDAPGAARRCWASRGLARRRRWRGARPGDAAWGEPCAWLAECWRRDCRAASFPA